MVRLRIDVAYDGTDFHGWARQPQVRTVQEVLEDAVAKVLRLAQAPLLVVAGRTDAGVHAVGQVCHVDIDDEILGRAVQHMDVSSIDALCIRLQRILATTDPDIRVHAVHEAPAGFDARFSALSRTYVYRVCTQVDNDDPRIRGFVYMIHHPLDVAVMNRACTEIIGLHDFGSFATPNPGGTTIREVKAAQWSQVETRHDEFGVRSIGSGIVEFHIVADAFAHNMVRSLVGALMLVGQGRKSVEWFAQKVSNPVREGATGPAPARGLSLERVEYPDDSQLASRALAIRAKRVM